MQQSPATQDMITPAEMKFWQEQAARAPELLLARRNEIVSKTKPKYKPILAFDWAFMDIGCAIAALSFSKYVPGKWKILTGALAGASATHSIHLGDKYFNAMSSSADHAADHFNRVISILQESPCREKEFAEYLSSYVTAADLQKDDLDTVVIKKAFNFFGHAKDQHMHSINSIRSR